MMKSETPVIVRITRRFSASAERVFDAWLDAKTAGEWLFATPTGRMVRVEIDPRVGGSFTIVERRDGEDVAHIGRYLEIDRPRRLVFEFGFPNPSESPELDRVTVEIVQQGTGCELTLTHELKPEWKDYAGRTESGWTGILEGLAAALD